MNNKRSLFFFLFFSFFTVQLTAQGLNQCTPTTGNGSLSCASSCISCDLNGVSSRTDGFLPPGFSLCFSAINLDHPRWFGFIAGSTNLTLAISFGNCSNGNGLEFAVRENCFTEIACFGGPNMTGFGGMYILPIANLVVGRPYQFVVDGFNADICDFTINVVAGTTIPPSMGPIGAISGTTQVCPNATVNYTIPHVQYALTYTWVAPAGASINGLGSTVTLPATGSNNSVDITFGTAGGNVCVIASNACSSPINTCIQVSNIPLAATQLPDEIICNNVLPYEWPEEPHNTLAAPGTYNLTSTPYISYLGCDSIVKQKLTVLPPNVKNLPVRYLCKDECYTINGIEYCETGAFQEILTTDLGCDSTVNFTLIKIVSKAVIAKPDTITCAVTSVPLTGVGSTTGNTVTYRWLNPDGQQISAGITATANGPGEYALIVTNQVGGVACMDTAFVTVPGNLTPPLADAGPNKVLTCIVTQVQLDGTGSSGPDYTYFWKSQLGGNIVSGALTLNPIVNAPGTYTLRVTNNHNGCTAISNATVTANVTPPVVTAAGGTFTCTQPNIALQVATNAPNPGYAWTGPNNFSSNLKNPLVGIPGLYTVVVTNGITGCTASATATVLAGNDTPDASATGGAITCAQNNVTLTANSSFNGVTYAWSGPNGFTSIQQNPVVSATGNYQLVITAPNGCTNSASTSVILNTTAPGTTLATSGSLNCNNTVVNVLATNIGNPPELAHQWTLPSGATQSTGPVAFLPASVPGLYLVTVFNTVNGCSSTASINVVQFAPVSASIGNAQNPNCSNSNDGTLSVQPVGGNGVYSYAWSNAATTATNSNLGTGTYSVTVTDGEGCSATASGAVTAPNPLEANASATDQTSNGATDGTASANPSGGTPGYTYLWSNSATSPSITALLPGSYTVTVSDANGCTDVQTVNVSQYNCLLQTQVVSTNISCFGAADGLATVQIDGGTNPVVITWSNSNTTDTLFGLSAGQYAVTITDAANCQEVQTFTITEPTALAANASGSVTTGVGTNDGTATASPTGGTGNYSYVWSNTETSATLNNLSPGTYTVTVSDANGCSAIQSVEVEAGNCNLTTDLQLTHPSCNGLSDGAATIVLTGGAGGFIYAWSSGGSGATENNLSAGTHMVTITDANACSIIVNTELVAPPALVLTLDSTQTTSCANLPEGSASVSAAGGTGSLSIAWSDGQIGQTANGLTAGTFTAVVTDANACTTALAVEILTDDNINPVIVANDTNVPIGPDGTVVLTPANTNATITDNCVIASIVFEPASFTCTQLGEHVVQITVTDDAGNSNSQTITATIVDDAPPSLICSPSLVLCNVDNPVSYQAPTATDNCLLLGGAFTILEGLPIGALFPIGSTTTTYAFTDAQGNVGTCSFEVTILTPFIIEVDTVYNDFNFQQIGAIFINPAGSLPPYTYSWTLNGQVVSTQQNLTGVGAGDYTLVVTDDNGCTVAIENITISNTSAVNTLPGLDEIRVFPNPTAGNLSVLLPDVLLEQNLFVQIYDQTGRRVMAQTSMQQKQIDLALLGLSDGLYSLVIRAGNDQVVRKIVLNK